MTFLVVLITFVLLHAVPGGEAKAILGSKATPSRIAAFDRENGLAGPLPLQFIGYLGRLCTGDLGFSVPLNQPVSQLLAERLPKTLVLNFLALLLTVIVAVPAGIYQAVRRNGVFDYTVTALSFVFYAAPPFFLGLLLIGWFADDLGWLPPEAPQSDGVVPLFAQFPAMVLPIVTLALLSISGFSRYMRSSVLDNLNLDYVRTAYAKGASNGRVLYRHVLRNAMIPIVTLLGLSLSSLFAGGLITESLFNFPGMGLLFYQAAQVNDYPVELGVVLITAVATVVGNLAADFALALLDPRVAL